MSGVSAALNSSGTLVAVDIVKRIRPRITDQQLVLVGRVSSIVIMLLAVLWSTQGGRFTSIFAAINVIASDLAPPITTVFLFGVFWRRGTKEASVVTLLAGFLMGVASFVLYLPVFGDTKLISDGLGMHSMMQASWMFCICSLIFLFVSLGCHIWTAHNKSKRSAARRSFTAAHDDRSIFRLPLTFAIGIGPCSCAGKRNHVQP